jgi:hypothetical protein
MIAAGLGRRFPLQRGGIGQQTHLPVDRPHDGSDFRQFERELGVLVATSGDVREQPKIADDASELLQDLFSKDKSPCRLVYGVASLPLGTPVELDSFSRWGKARRAITARRDSGSKCLSKT